MDSGARVRRRCVSVAFSYERRNVASPALVETLAREADRPRGEGATKLVAVEHSLRGAPASSSHLAGREPPPARVHVCYGLRHARSSRPAACAARRGFRHSSPRHGTRPMLHGRTLRRSTRWSVTIQARAVASQRPLGRAAPIAGAVVGRQDRA